MTAADRDPFSLRLFMPHGDPDGVRIVDRMNWTGKAIAFPRDQWPRVRGREELQGSGVYILVGPPDEAPDDAPELVYVGQSETLSKRIARHEFKKAFWQRCVIFVSTHDNGLNRAHTLWLEHALWMRALEAGQYTLENLSQLGQPSVSEAETADLEAFLSEILRILPLVNISGFEKRRAIVPGPINTGVSGKPGTSLPSEQDTIIVPARAEGFNAVFLGENSWYAIRVSGRMLERLKWVTAYQVNPVQAITHVAPIQYIEPFGDAGKYRLVFAEPARAIPPIPFGDAPSGAMQGPRYTTKAALDAASTVADLVGGETR